MTDDKGNKVKSAGPSTPVEVVGLTEVPTAGEVFYEVDNEKIAKHLIDKRRAKEREAMINASAPVIHPIIGATLSARGCNNAS